MSLNSLLGLKKKQPKAMSTARLDAYDESDPFMSLYRKAIQVMQNGTRDNQEKQMRFFVMAQLVSQAVRTMPDLDLAECGCFMGHSTFMTASLMREGGAKGALHVFDSFEGLSKFDDEDMSSFYADDDVRATLRGRFRADEAGVRQRLEGFDFIKFYKGWIPERFGEVAERTFSYVSIDVDMYQPTRDAIAFFYERLAPGGVMYLDDYGYKNFPGARASIDEFLATQTPPSLFMRMPFGSAFLRK